jgi:ABC-type glycerol-3-phosphate transport system permease component
MMRILHPEIRKLSISSKLRYSFFISIIAFIFAAITSGFFGYEFLFVTFPAIAFLVYIFDKIILLPHDKVVKKIGVPVRRKKNVL